MYPLKLVRWRYNKKGESGKEARVLEFGGWRNETGCFD